LQFAPSYSDYVLYSDGGPADNVKRKKYRGQKGQKQKTKGLQGALDFGESRGPSRLGQTPQPNAKTFEATRCVRYLQSCMDEDPDRVLVVHVTADPLPASLLRSVVSNVLHKKG
jgi:hypothetical protein